MTGMTEFPSHIRKSIRDTERMLARPNLPATVRQQQERKLRALQLAVEGKAVLEKQQKIATKYRMVRFFEAKKAARYLSQTLKSEEEAAIQEAVKDALYVKFFPKDQKYISLFPSVPCVDEEVLAKRSAMRESIFEAHGAEYDSQVSIQLLAAKPAAKSKSSQDDDGSEIEDDDESDEDDDEDSNDDDDESDDDIDDDDEFDDSDDSDDDSLGDEDEGDEDDVEDDEDEDDDEDDDDSEDWSSDEDDSDEDDDEDDDDEGSEESEEDDSDAGSSRKKSRV